MELSLYRSFIGDIKSRILQGQGNAVIPRIEGDIKNELSDLKGFPKRNFGYMVQFAKAYPDQSILQQPAAKSPSGHNSVLLQSVKDLESRNCYANESLRNGWEGQR